jgi:ABC-2 type transport system ATP-binding protein
MTAGPVPLRPEPAIRLRGLTKIFADRVAVNSMTLDVAPGELFGFLGPNGAGKTTTIKLLTGLLRPTLGSAELCGHDVVTDSLRARAVAGYVPDQPALYDKLTGREMLGLAGSLEEAFLRLTGADGDSDVRPLLRALVARIDPLLGALGLDDHADRLVQSYSRGMRQKLALGAALLHDPRVLLLDEPTVGLDPAGARQLKDVLRGLCADGRTVFLSTHVLEVAELLCDRVGVVHQGRLVAVETPAELRTALGAGSLEEAFLRLTGADGDSDVRPLLRALE